MFTVGQYTKEDVAKLLGRVTVPDNKPENREIKPNKTESTQMKHTMKETKQDIKKSDAKPTLSLSSFATKIRKYIVPGVDSVDHISGSGKLWVSDLFGNLVLSDLQGKQLQKIKTNGKHGMATTQ